MDLRQPVNINDGITFNINISALEYFNTWRFDINILKLADPLIRS